MRHHHSITTLLTLCAIFAPALACAEEPPPELNRAQTLIFMGDHLQQIPAGQTVVYDFTQRIPGQPDKTDEVRMTVTKVNDDSLRDLSFEFLSGPDRLPFPPARSYRGNPVVIQFLERDIRDLSTATGTPVGYFRNRIRKAFSDPQIEQIQVKLNGSELDAVEISITPFKDDPNLAHMPGYPDRLYQFDYSEQVPGHLLGIRARMLDEAGAPLEEELHFNRMTDAAL